MWPRIFRPRVPRVRQHDLMDCGAACLYAVARYYGHRLPIARLRQYASTDREGTNVLGMVEAASRMGFLAKGVKGPFESLFKIPKPCIAHVIAEEGPHYVVLCDATPRQIVVMDPADGELHRLGHEEFRARWTGVLVLMVPGEQFQPRHEGQSVVSRFWALLRPHRTVLAQALAGAAVYTLLGLSTAIYVQKIVDHVLVGGNRDLLNLLGVAMLLLLAAQVYLGVMKDLFTLRTGQRIDAALILGYYQHLLRLPQRFFDTMRVGEVVSRVGDAVKIRAFLNDVALDLAVNAMVLVFAFAFMLLYSWQLALVVLALLPLYGGIYWLTNRVNRKQLRRVMESAAELEAQLVESLNGAGTLKRFGLEEYADRRTEARFTRLLRSVYRAGTNGVFAGSASELVSRLAVIVLLWAGAGLVLDRTLSPGELMSFYALAGYLTGPIVALIGANHVVQDALIAADRLFEILDLEREAQERSVELTPAQVGDVCFEGVDFRYGTRAQVFAGLDLVVPRGRLTAVVGESGSGKSTLAALLQNLYPLAAGRVRIGEYDVRHLSTPSLRRCVGVVPRTIQLFSGNVLENIALGDPEPDFARVLDLCRRLGIHAFIDALPEGYHTPLGENGATLSGGQRQRLAIARALYRDPEILVLDEATSSLDSVSERYVQVVLQALCAAGKTVLLIAHRLSTAAVADRIAVLADGGVAEEGTHHALLSQQGAYSRLWEYQQLGSPAACPQATEPSTGGRDAAVPSSATVPAAV